MGNRRLRLEYVRRKDASDLTYQVWFGSQVVGTNVWQTAPGPDSVTSIDAAWERVTIDDNAAGGTEPARYGNVRVTLQP